MEKKKQLFASQVQTQIRRITNPTIIGQDDLTRKLTEHKQQIAMFKTFFEASPATFAQSHAGEFDVSHLRLSRIVDAAQKAELYVQNPAAMQALYELKGLYDQIHAKYTEK